MPYLNARHIGDGVARAGHRFETNAEFARSRFGLPEGGEDGDESEERNSRQHAREDTIRGDESGMLPVWKGITPQHVQRFDAAVLFGSSQRCLGDAGLGRQ